MIYVHTEIKYNSGRNTHFKASHLYNADEVTETGCNITGNLLQSISESLQTVQSMT